jgi:hypothetical protein
VKATMEGVVLAPSAFAITVGLPPSMTATQLFVVPRSIPMILLIIFLLISTKNSIICDFVYQTDSVSITCFFLSISCVNVLSVVQVLYIVKAALPLLFSSVSVFISACFKKFS